MRELSLSSTREVPRIPAPTREVFRQCYLEQQQPVIMTGLFDGQALSHARTEEAARATFGWLRIPVATEYLAAMSSNEGVDGVRNMRLDEYLELQQTSPGTHRMCSEKPTPDAILNNLELPPYDSYEDSISSFFVGHAGHHAHMHFDGDFRHVLFHQVFGTKRFVFIPPTQNHFVPAIGNFSEWSLENYSAEELERVLQFTGGSVCTLHAGETLFIPASIWHFVEYTTTSMSLNLRFGRNAYTKFLGERVHLSKWAQTIAWVLGDAATVTEGQRKEYYRLVEATEKQYVTPEERYRHMDDLLRQTADTLCGIGKPRSLLQQFELRERYRTGSIANYGRIFAHGALEGIA